MVSFDGLYKSVGRIFAHGIFFPPKNFGEFRSILVKEVVTLTYQAFPDCLVHICFKYVLFNANIYWYKCEN